MDQLVNFIIRPPRAEYNPEHDLLEATFKLRGRWFQRKDLVVVNGNGKKLQCSHYMPLLIPEGKRLPCVIYCHGNSGCRADASEAAIILLPSNITVFALDFSGSGLSEGEYVTLGWNEKDDLKAAVNYLRADDNISCIGLWGRSMGAVTSLMYGAEDPSIAGMVLDSPFANLVDLMMELVDTYKYPLPKFTVKLAIQHMRKVVKKKANFDIMELDATQVAKQCFVPALFGHATDDDFIHPRHSDRIYDSYVGDKNIIKFDGDHNSPRPQFYFDSVTIFFHNVLTPPSDLPGEIHFGENNWDVQSMGYRIVPPPTVGATSAAEHDIAELRSRRGMSRIEVPSTASSHDSSNGPERKENDGEGAPSSTVCVTPSNGPTEGYLAPIADEDDYVEYSFQTFSDMPYTEDDEERMLMEAIMASLADVKVQEKKDNGAAVPPVPVDSCSTAIEPTLGSKNMSETAESSQSADGAEIRGKDTAASSNGSPALEAQTADQSIDNNTCPSESGDGTRATLVVQRNRSGNLIDGLTQRLGFNFFKNSG